MEPVWKQSKNSLFLSPKGKRAPQSKLGPVWGPQHPQPCPDCMAFWLTPDQPSAPRNPSPLSQGPGHLAAHGLGCPHQLAATQQWRQLCGCRKRNTPITRQPTRAFPRVHAPDQPVGLQEHLSARSCRWGLWQGCFWTGLCLGCPFLDCPPFPPGGKLANLSHPGGRQGQGSSRAGSHQGGLGRLLLGNSTFVLLSHPYIVSLASRRAWWVTVLLWQKTEAQRGRGLAQALAG